MAIGINLPDSIQFVSYQVDTEDFWQRPVEGFVQVPNPPLDDPSLRFYNAAGVEVSLPDRSDPNLALIDQLGVKLTESQRAELAATLENGLQVCLSATGADSATGAIEPGRDPGVVWNTCIETARLEWRSHAADLGLIAMASGWTPPGTEIPVRDGTPPEGFGPIKQEFPVAPGTAQWIEVDGLWNRFYFQSVREVGGAVIRIACTGQQSTSFSCGDGASGDSIDWMGSADEAGDTYSIGSNVPDDVAFVGFLNSGELAWQRPLNGMVYLPGTDFDASSIHLYDGDGNTIASTIEPQASIVITSLPNDPPEGDERMAGTFTEALTDCLTENGADPATGDNATGTGTGTDAKVIWEDCLTVGSTAWQAKAHELGLD